MDIRYVISLLQKHGMTQKDIALSIRYSQASISCYARGIYGLTNPSNKLIDGLRKLLADKGLSESPD